MEEKLLEAFNEMNNTNYHHLSSTKDFGYSPREVLEAYLNYEGIIGYTCKTCTIFFVNSIFILFS